MFNERRQPSRGGTSRMTRECQVRFCEGLGVKFPGPTRQKCERLSVSKSSPHFIRQRKSPHGAAASAAGRFC